MLETIVRGVGWLEWVTGSVAQRLYVINQFRSA
jgi:hypothetical protein